VLRLTWPKNFHPGRIRAEAQIVAHVDPSCDHVRIRLPNSTTAQFNFSPPATPPLPLPSPSITYSLRWVFFSFLFSLFSQFLFFCLDMLHTVASPPTKSPVHDADGHHVTTPCAPISPTSPRASPNAGCATLLQLPHYQAVRQHDAP
jgi:hypothetical protein